MGLGMGMGGMGGEMRDNLKALVRALGSESHALQEVSHPCAAACGVVVGGATVRPCCSVLLFGCV